MCLPRGKPHHWPIINRRVPQTVVRETLGACELVANIEIVNINANVIFIIPTENCALSSYVKAITHIKKKKKIRRRDYTDISKATAKFLLFFFLTTNLCEKEFSTYAYTKFEYIHQLRVESHLRMQRSINDLN